MERKALAIANNDLVYLWWTYSEKIPDCLGFSIRRFQKGKAPVALPAPAEAEIAVAALLAAPVSGLLNWEN